MFAGKIFIALAAMAAVVAGAKQSVPGQKRHYELSHKYSFEEYMKDFRLSFPASELEERKALFEAELSRVLAHNAKGASWKETVNKFSAMRPEERRAFYGRSKGVAQHQAKQGMLKGQQEELPFALKPVSELPENVDWRTEGVVSAVKDQGHCGSCWAFASTAVIESHVAISTGLLFDLSVEQIAMCSPNPNSCGGTGGCEGATAELAFEYATGSAGLMQEYQYPYTSYYGEDYECSVPSGTAPVATIDGYVKLPANNYTALMNAVAQVGPVAISVDASTWHAYDSGVYSGCDQRTPDINHGVVLVGYGEDAEGKYWLVRNSWSPAYGESGFIRIARTEDEDELCGMDVTPADGIACEGETQPMKVCGTCGVIFDAAYPLNANTL